MPTLSPKNSIRMNPKVPVKLKSARDNQILYWPWNPWFARDKWWKNARDIFAFARVNFAKIVPVNAKSAREDLEKKNYGDEKVLRGKKKHWIMKLVYLLYSWNLLCLAVSLYTVYFMLNTPPMT